MQKMSSADLSAAIAELAGLAGKRIAKIRRTAGGIFLFKIGPGELLFEPGVRLHLTRQSFQATESPDGFVAFLRRNFEGKTAQEIRQAQSDRIAEIVTRSDERLVFELFRRGNLVAVSEEGVILSCLQSEEAGGRKISRGERYAYPLPTNFAQKTPAQPGFAVQVDAGGAPVSFSLDAASGGRTFPSFSEAADFYYANQKSQSDAERAAGGRLKKLEQRLASQKAAQERIAMGRLAAKSAGDAIYAQFERLEGLLALARKLRKEGKPEEETNRELSNHGAALRGTELEVELG